MLIRRVEAVYKPVPSKGYNRDKENDREVKKFEDIYRHKLKNNSKSSKKEGV